MRTLILSCNTGAGHNSCARAIQQAYRANGEVCDIVDALTFISERASQFISNWHTRIYLYAPRLFSAGYEKAEHREDLFREGTAVYRYITSGVRKMYECIAAGGYDNVICTHVFPALALTELRRRFPDLRVLTSHVSTDYTCSPCTADSGLDWYFMPAAALEDEFVRCGIPREKLVASGMPVRREFYARPEKAQAKRAPGLRPEQRHLVMMCGSMGCGPMEELTLLLGARMQPGDVLSVVCSKNETLLRKLQKQTAGAENVRLLGQVDDVPALLHGADVFLTKPGGLSTSEAVAARLPMVLIDAVAGCEEHNLDFFLRAGMAVTANTPNEIANLALELAHSEARLAEMRRAMETVAGTPADIIHDWLRDHQTT